MNKVHLKSDGFLISDEQPIGDDPIPFLNNNIVFETGVVFRSYFKMLETYPVLKKVNHFISNSISQYYDCAENGCTWDGFDYLEFGKTVEMIGFPGKPRLEIYNGFHGVQSHETCEIKSISLNCLLDIPLRLGKLKHIVFGDSVDSFEFETNYNLFELIDGIAWELSFHTGPEKCKLRR